MFSPALALRPSFRPQRPLPREYRRFVALDKETEQRIEQPVSEDAER